MDISIRNNFVRERLGLPPLVHIETAVFMDCRDQQQPATPECPELPQLLTSRTDPGSGKDCHPALGDSPPGLQSARGSTRGSLRQLTADYHVKARKPSRVTRSFARAARFAAPFPYNTSAAYDGHDGAGPGPGAYTILPSVGMQSSSLRRNSPSPIKWTPGALSLPSTAGISTRELQAARVRMRECRAKASAVLEQLKRDRTPVSLARLLDCLNTMGFDLSGSDGQDLFGAYVSGSDENVDIWELDKALWSSKALSRRLCSFAEEKRLQRTCDSVSSQASQDTASSRAMRLDSKALTSMRMEAAATGSRTVEELRSRLAINATRIIELLALTDLASPEEVSAEELYRAVGKLGLKVTRADCAALFSSWDLAGRGSLALVQLNSILRRGGHVERAPLACWRAANTLENGRAVEEPKKAVRKPVDDLRYQERLLLILATDKERVGDAFAYLDQEGRGIISKRDFRTGLSLLSVAADRADMDRLFDVFDPDGTGEMELDELLQIFLWAYRNRKTKLLLTHPLVLDGSISVQEQLRDLLSRSLVRAIDLFRHLCGGVTRQDEAHVISKRLFRKGLSILGMRAPPQEIDALLDSFDSSRTGLLGLRELQQTLKRTEVSIHKIELNKKKRQEETLVCAEVEQLREELMRGLGNLHVEL